MNAAAPGTALSPRPAKARCSCAGHDGHITGLVGYKGRIYTVASLGGQLHAVVEMDPRQMPPDHAAAKPTADPRADLRPDAPAKVAAAAIPPAVAPLSDSERQALEAKKIVIDLMLLYTKKAASRYVRDPKDLMEMAHRAGQRCLSQQRPRQYQLAPGAHPGHRLRRVGRGSL